MTSARVRRALLGGALAVVLAALAGCGGGPPARIGDSPYSPYVAMGDSYTAGPLSPVQSGDGCLRSSANYPALVAARLHIPDVVDRSCGGARITDLLHGGNGHEPQVDALTRDTRLVTIGVGGNDDDIAATLYTTCFALATSAPTGSPCEDSMRRSDGTDRLLSAMPGIEDRMAGLLEEVRRRAPGAKVLVVGYPQGVPDAGTCPDRLPLATGDYAYFRRVMDALNASLRRATGAAGDVWVDTWRASKGHDVCSDDPWINGATPLPGKAAALHPLESEQKAVARLVAQAAERA
jgi:hypothetical protein